LDSSSRGFRLQIEDELTFKAGEINLIVGPTGSGKSSLLAALLGEMHYIPLGTSSWFNLPRSGGVAYAPQESWVLNDTIRANIVFGSPYEDQRYRQGKDSFGGARSCAQLRTVLRACALERDLELFEAGDLSEVGERGLTLR
jgi:ABC-type multidrug transport system fused ATPase/permease subunit